MSRRSLFGAYAHQPNMSKYSYPSDVSLSSHYGYTSWGLWRDTGHLSPSVYSKKRINIRSFSILIMSAAFIVLLAVLSVAALAFYFSTFKSDSNECKFSICYSYPFKVQHRQTNNYSSRLCPLIWLAHHVCKWPDLPGVDPWWKTIIIHFISFRFILLPHHQRLSCLIAYFELLREMCTRRA